MIGYFLGVTFLLASVLNSVLVIIKGLENSYYIPTAIFMLVGIVFIIHQRIVCENERKNNKD